MLLKKIFLPAGLLIAILIAAFQPDLGAPLKNTGFISWLVATIFLINGHEIQLTHLALDRSFTITFLVAIVINLLLAPCIGLAASVAAGLPASLAIGLIVISTVPPTLTSGIVLTDIAKGNKLWALVMTIGLNLLGVITVPFMLTMCLRMENDINVSAVPLLLKLIKIVILPFLLGIIVKALLKSSKTTIFVKYIPSICVILTVWITLSASRDLIVILAIRHLLSVSCCSFGVHTFLLILCYVVGLPLKLRRADHIPLIFVASQKTLPLSLSVLASLGGGIGPAVVACVIYHFIQLFMDSTLASWLSSQSPSSRTKV